MKVLLVEDEINAALKLNNILMKISSNITILEVCDSVESTSLWLNNHDQPDLIFMDIQLSDGISFEIFKQVTITCPIIFITAFNNFAIQAFEVNSIDYILKPYSIDQVTLAIEKYKTFHLKPAIKHNSTLFEELAKNYKPNYKTRFYTKLNHSVFAIQVEDIQYFIFEDNATILVNNDFKKFVLNYSLDALEKLLDPTRFFRINRQFIISFGSIIKMDISLKNRIQVNLKNDQREMVSRVKTKDFKDWLDV